MGVYLALLLVTVGALSHANRLPYLGGDITDVITDSKQPDLSDPAQAWLVTQRKPVEQKPVTEKQKRDSTNYNTKFNDIARAYAEGYKAAIKAVQQRAIIARRRLQTIRSPYAPQSFPYPRSFIPGPNPYILGPMSPLDARVGKSFIPQPPLVEGVPVPEQEAAPSEKKQAKDVISPSPVGDLETKTLPTLSDLPDNKAAKEQLVSRSIIPSAPVAEPSAPATAPETKKSEVATPNKPAAVTEEAAPKPAQVTENGVEKSAIPSAPTSPSDIALEIKERSTKVEMPKMPKLVREDHPAFPKSPVHLRTDEERSKIAKMNARARHRNAYFDASGGDPFNGGGVLSRQNAISVDKKHKKKRRRRHIDEEHRPRTSYKKLRRHRRSHMPYLGQNLDAMGVVRATPKSWTSPQVRKSLEARKAASQVLQTPGPFAYLNHPSAEFGPSPFSQAMPGAFRGEIPGPPGSMAMMGPPPMAQMNFARMFPGPIPGGIPVGGPPGQFPGFRSMIPGYPAFYGMPGPLGFPLNAPLPAGLVNEEIPSAESSTGKPEDVREKKSTIPMPPDFHEIHEIEQHPEHLPFDLGRIMRLNGKNIRW